MKFSELVKASVRERTQMLCDRCGLSVRHPQYHHRRPRGMGGSDNTIIGLASNALLLHPNCHEWIERNRTAAVKNGWLVRSWDDPADVPILRCGEWMFLNTDGSMSPAMSPSNKMTDVDSAIAITSAQEVPSARSL